MRQHSLRSKPTRIIGIVTGRISIGKILLSLLLLLIHSTGSMIHACQAPTSGLIAYYPFSGNANDASGFGHDGLVLNAVLTQDRYGIPNSAYYFNGSNSIIKFPGLDWNTAASFTTALWFKWKSKDFAVMLEQGDGTSGTFVMNLAKETPPQKLRVCVAKPVGPWYSVQCEFADTANWHHMALVYDKVAGTFSQYVDGWLTASQAIDTVCDRSDTVCAGQGIGNTEPGWFNGMLDEIRIYSEALTPSQVFSLYCGDFEAPQYFAGTGHWYQLAGPNVCWTDAEDSAIARGGYLATILSAGEDAFVRNLNSPTVAAWLGGLETSEGVWTWVTSEPWGYASWASGEPNNGGGGNPEGFLMQTPVGWNDGVDCHPSAWIGLPYVIEWNQNPLQLDTLRIGNSDCLQTLYPAPQVMPVVYSNSDTIKAGDIPLCYDWPFDPDSVSFVGTRLSDMEFKIGTIDNSNKRIRIGFISDLSGSGKVLAPEAQNEPIALLYFSPPSGCGTWLQAPDTCSLILSADTIRLEFVDKHGVPSTPIFQRDSARILQYRIGDCDGNGMLSISDAVCMVSYIFSGGQPNCIAALDCDCSGVSNISDIVYLINYIFAGGPQPGQNCQCTSGPLAKATPHGTAGISTSFIGNSLNIQSTTSTDLQAVQLQFAANGDVNDINVSCTDPRFQVFSGWVDGEYRVGVIDLTGKTTLPAGTHDLLKISCSGDGEFVLNNAIVVDGDAQEMNVTINRSKSDVILPTEFALYQNQPNPFNPSTDISFSLPKASDVKLVIYNLLGQEVATLVDEFMTAGVHRATWSGRDDSGRTVASGVYMYRLEAGEFSQAKKMMLLK